ncbi:MAG: CHRD domain-containing protein, partial [Acetobacteraceae bacterium]|nr:CHRD domain-containing protein [Acetobacteraceae bacterium]
HFHGPAEPGQNAPVVIPLSQPLTSPIKGKVTLTDQQMNDLMANKWYVNVHTKEDPMGEIRGQVTHGGP